MVTAARRVQAATNNRRTNGGGVLGDVDRLAQQRSSSSHAQQPAWGQADAADAADAPVPSFVPGRPSRPKAPKKLPPTAPGVLAPTAAAKTAAAAAATAARASVAADAQTSRQAFVDQHMRLYVTASQLTRGREHAQTLVARLKGYNRGLYVFVNVCVAVLLVLAACCAAKLRLQEGVQCGLAAVASTLGAVYLTGVGA